MKRKVIGPPGRSVRSCQIRCFTSEEKPYQSEPATIPATISATAIHASRVGLLGAFAISSRAVRGTRAHHLSLRIALAIGLWSYDVSGLRAARIKGAAEL